MKKGWNRISWLALIALAVATGCQSEAEKEAKKPLYDRLGQDTQITAIVDDLVARVAVDSQINFTRKGTPAEWHPTPENVARLKAHLVQYIESATGGPQKYQGRDMKRVHANMQITSAEFDAFLTDLSITLDKFSIVDPTKLQLIEKLNETRKDVVMPDED